jgi:hypothetical protein
MVRHGLVRHRLNDLELALGLKHSGGVTEDKLLNQAGWNEVQTYI